MLGVAFRPCIGPVASSMHPSLVLAVVLGRLVEFGDGIEVAACVVLVLDNVILLLLLIGMSKLKTGG